MAKKPRTIVEHEADAGAPVPNGAPDGLTIVRLKVADLLADPANVRIHDERNLSAIKASLAKFGQQKPIVVDANNIVIAGNGTLDAAQALGWETINCVRTDLSGPMAVGYSIADNRSSELASWDDDALARTLESLRDEDFDLEAVGFLDAEVEELIAGLGRAPAAEGDVVDDPQGEWQGMPECENNDDPAFRSLIVHFADQESVDEFAKMIGQPFSPGVKFIWHPKRGYQDLTGCISTDEP